MIIHFRPEKSKQIELSKIFKKNNISIEYFPLYNYIPQYVKPNIKNPDFLVITSPFCVDFISYKLWNKYLKPNIAIIAVGLNSARKIKEKFKHINIIYPKNETIDGVINEIVAYQDATQFTYTILKGNDGNLSLIDYLYKCKVKLDIINLYTRELSTNLDIIRKLNNQVKHEFISGVIITSTNQYELFIDLISNNEYTIFYEKIHLFVASAVIFDKIVYSCGIKLFNSINLLNNSSSDKISIEIIDILKSKNKQVKWNTNA